MNEEGITVKTAPKKFGDLIETKNEPVAVDEKDEVVKKLKDALAPFTKLPYEPNQPKEKVMFRLTRGAITADITNGDIIRAKKIFDI